jgi:hypothetical protein
VWFDDSIAGMSFVTLSGVDSVNPFFGATGTRHVVVRASNATRSATWNIFFQGAGSACRISAEAPSASSLSAASVKRGFLGRPAVRSAALGRKSH